MNNPYQPRPESLEAHRRRVNEERLITLQDDSKRSSATIGTPSWQGMILGSSSGQPSKADNSIRPSWGKRLFRIAFWIWGALMVLGLCMRIAALMTR